MFSFIVYASVIIKNYWNTNLLILYFNEYYFSEI